MSDEFSRHGKYLSMISGGPTTCRIDPADGTRHARSRHSGSIERPIVKALRSGALIDHCKRETARTGTQFHWHFVEMLQISSGSIGTRTIFLNLI
jgi:hypothetical protein